MGTPKSGWQDVPLSREVETAAFPLVVNGVEFIASADSMGNPHCVIFTGDAGQVPLSDLGPLIECHEVFPARTNVEFASVISPGRLRMRVWERGAGITEACGTGACATVVAAHRRGLSPRIADVILDGGLLNIEWSSGDDHVLMTGPTSLAFKGDIDLTTPEYRA
jgi:diaminopimelate epimerase